ncbi:MAG: bifunctional proline dehydrogenase/L-glutamate gamma-semialdehyde dehydrogenase PutA, partial [Micavibrio sp.]|nr:bifunctional proline dehydrogenase/L-glutamate gamma-semialdehyde dehydrogenase PutA [Micavibrio sp.]
ACTEKMFQNANYIYPMMATHNAHTIATVLQIAKASGADFEFQRLFGMGEGIYDILLKNYDVKACIYAPVGPHHDLLPYLVRRLLENGANTSFVNKVMRPNAPLEEIVTDPVDRVRNEAQTLHPSISLPKDIFRTESKMGRCNSHGLDLHAPETMVQLNTAFKRFQAPFAAMPIINGKAEPSATVSEKIINPANKSDEVGHTYFANGALVDKTFSASSDGFRKWNAKPARTRADALRKAGDLLEKNFEELMALLIREAGKTIPDAYDEIREAVDFCRYYANQGELHFADNAYTLPGPTGEYNALRLGGRGTFVCISPWNFPLAIFTGQIMAALMAGNTVIAKPAEQTPLIAYRAVQLFHEAGINKGALHLLPGDGRIGASLIEHKDVAGVAFTGSTETARLINQALARKEGAIIPLIAETGGQNAMIVDSSALPEQVVDDVMRSAFGSAGQRCSALRILCLQNDTADTIIHMLQGRMKEMTLGEPVHLSTDVGPVIDEEALANLHHHINALDGYATPLATVTIPKNLEGQGYFFAPAIYEIENLCALTREVFGPILHIIRYDAKEIDDLLDQIRATGYGLTLGVHSRIKSFQNKIINTMPVGNIYINRSMTGAIVGSQPFGGMGLSGTGPKAGGPHYLPRFAAEKAISVNTTAAGGNTTLITLKD